LETAQEVITDQAGDKQVFLVIHLYLAALPLTAVEHQDAGDILQQDEANLHILEDLEDPEAAVATLVTDRIVEEL
jgi:hypothetical protein